MVAAVKAATQRSPEKLLLISTILVLKYLVVGSSSSSNSCLLLLWVLPSYRFPNMAEPSYLPSSTRPRNRLSTPKK